MLTTRELGEQLSFEFAGSALSPTVRARLIARAVRLEDRRVAADPVRRTGPERRPDRTVERLAIAQILLAVLAFVAALVMLAGDRTRLGAGFAMAAASSTVLARAALVLSADRRMHVLPDGTDRTGPTAGTPGPAEIQIDLRDLEG
jgi:hypothetical protein